MFPEMLSVLCQVKFTASREPRTLPEPVPAVWQAVNARAAVNNASNGFLFMISTSRHAAHSNAGRKARSLSALSRLRFTSPVAIDRAAGVRP